VTPLTARVTATLEPTNTSPLAEMPVAGPPDCRQGPKVAVLDVDGLLVNFNPAGFYSNGDNPVDLFKQKLDAAAADPDVCAVVVRINSPGGAVAATDMMWRELLAFRDRTQRPVVACLMDLATSGGYYLATASDLIVAHPLTVTGAVGVVLNLYNLKDFMSTFNIIDQSIKAGAHIDAGSMTRALTPEERQMLQAVADEFYEHFKTVVRCQRPHLDLADGATLDGRVFTARQACQRGLVDRVGYLEDAIEAARGLAGQPSARVVLYHHCNDPARTPFATTPNVPAQATLVPFSMPGAERSRLPTFLYLWQPDPTLIRLGGK
jgi:protease-4